MDSLVIVSEPFFEWLTWTTLQESLLICVILLIQKALGYRLGVRGRYGLWLVLLVRLALPWAPQSRVSVYNLLPRSPSQRYEWSTAAPGNAGLTKRVVLRWQIAAPAFDFLGFLTYLFSV